MELKIPIKELTDRIKELDKIIMECNYKSLGDVRSVPYDAKRRMDSAIMETLVLKDLIKKYNHGNRSNNRRRKDDTA